MIAAGDVSVISIAGAGAFAAGALAAGALAAGALVAAFLAGAALAAGAAFLGAAAAFFGEPALELADLMRADDTGRGIINVLQDVLQSIEEMPEFTDLIAAGMRLTAYLAGSPDPLENAIANVRGFLREMDRATLLDDDGDHHQP